MLLLGTGGSTREQLLKATSVGTSDLTKLEGNVKNLVAISRGISSSTSKLSVAASVWLDSSLRLSAPYEQVLKAVFNAPPTVVDFSDCEKASNKINTWAVRRTILSLGQVPLFAQTSLSSARRLKTPIIVSRIFYNLLPLILKRS